MFKRFATFISCFVIMLSLIILYDFKKSEKFFELKGQQVSIPLVNARKKLGLSLAPTSNNIILIISDFGIQKKDYNLTLDKNFTLAISPYLSDPNLQKFVNFCQITQLPIVKYIYPNQPDDKAISQFNDLKQNNERIENFLIHHQNNLPILIDGRQNLCGYNKAECLSLLKKLDFPAKTIIYYNDDENNIFAESVNKLSMNRNKINLVVDSIKSPENIVKNLTKLEQISHNQNKAIGLLSADPETIAIVNKWVINLKEKNINIISFCESFKNEFASENL